MQTYTLLGNANHMIPILKRLLRLPFGAAITPARPDLGPFRNDHHFQELAAEKKP